MIQKLKNKVLALITRAAVDRSSDDTSVPQVQVRRYGKASVVEQFQPQGLYFRAPEGAEGILMATGGSGSSAVLVAAQDRETWPAGGGIEDGTGGLHYLGDWKVFLDAEGVLHLGTDAGESLISRDDKVQMELSRIQTELTQAKADITVIVAAVAAAVAAAAPIVPPAGDGGTAGFTALQSAIAALPTLAPASPGATAAANVKTS